MRRSIFTYGFIAGLIVGIPMVAMMWFYKDVENPPMSAAIGYSIMLIALSLVFVAIKQRRDKEGGGVIKFWPAFGMGVAISAVAGVMYAAAWEVSLAITGVDFAGHYADVLIAKRQAEGATPEEMQRFITEMETFKRDYANPFYRVPITFSEIFPIGVLASLLSAALLRNPRFMPARQR